MAEENTQNIEHDLFDHNRFHKMVYETALKDQISVHTMDFDKYPELVQDLFYGLFKYDPKYIDKNQIKKDYLINRKFIEKVKQSKQYGELRAHTKLNMTSSAIASLTLAENILEENKDILEEYQQSQQQIEKNKERLQELIDQYKDYKENSTTQSQQVIEEMKNKIQQVVEKNKEIKQSMEGNIDSLKVVTAIEETKESINAQEQLLSQVMCTGRGTEEGTYQPTTIEERLKFSQMFINNKKFKKLVQQIGRMKRLAEKKQKEKNYHSMDTLSSIKQSDDIFHLLPTELLYLSDPDLDILFYKNFLEKSLQTYELIGIESKGKGAIVCCVDISGSMSGNSDEIAKAIAIALVTIANKQKREAYIILFDHSVRKVIEFPKKSDKEYFNKINDLASYFTGGGTSFTSPLKTSIEQFEKNKSYNKADLVWITDGNGNLSKEVETQFLELKKAKKIHCYSIIIGSTFAFGDHPLKRISDVFQGVSDLNDDVASSLFSSV